MRKKFLKLGFGKSQGVSGAGVEVREDEPSKGGEERVGEVEIDGLGDDAGVDCILGYLCLDQLRA